MASLAHQLTALLQGTTTGIALVTAEGRSQASGDVFAGQDTDCAGGSPTLQELIAPFYSSPSEPPATTHTVNGVKVQVVQQSDSHYVAISKQRQLGLVALNTPLGVCLATFDRTTYPAAALTAVQAAVKAVCCGKAPQQCAARSSAGTAATAAVGRGPVTASS